MEAILEPVHSVYEFKKMLMDTSVEVEPDFSVLGPEMNVLNPQLVVALSC